MKNKSIISLVIFFMGLGFTTTSCEDMLTPDLERYTTQNGQDTIYSYLGILRGMQNIAERTVILGESRGDLVTTGIYTSDSIYQIATFNELKDGDNKLLQVSDYYYVINQCNFYLANADTAAIKNGKYYMQKEYAQVQAMRGWTYLQLVQNYGSVPFVTVPVYDTEQGKALESAERVTKSNLAEKLIKAGLNRALTIQEQEGFPNYGAYNYGSGGVTSRACMIPVQLVLADAYLLNNQYEEAARMYYSYMKEYANVMSISPYSVNYTTMMMNGITSNYITATSYTTSFSSNVSCNDQKASSNVFIGETQISLIPGAANNFFGKMFTSVQHVYGFKTTSRVATTTTETNKNNGQTEEEKKDDKGPVTSSSGYISVRADKKYQQLLPSTNYERLSAAQLYANWISSEGSTEGITRYDRTIGDGRIVAAAPRVTVDGITSRYIAKACPATMPNSRFTLSSFEFSNRYAISLYRKSLLYLRYAEAINRAGFPQHAFAVLKDGLGTTTLPTWTTITDSIKNPDGGFSTVQRQGRKDPTAVSGGAYYIDAKETEKASHTDFIKFTDKIWSQNLGGIHSLGSGYNDGYHDTLYTYSKCVAQKIAEKIMRKNNIPVSELEILKLKLEQNPVNPYTGEHFTAADTIQAVEDMIIDELALETAFEGNRYPDLLRIAGHRNDYDWLAWKIARRNYSIWDPYDQYDENLYNRIKSGTNLYLKLPE